MLLTVQHFVHVFLQSTLCPFSHAVPWEAEPWELHLQISLVDCPLLGLYQWEPLADCSRMEWKTTYLFPAPLFLLYKVSDSSCMPAGHALKFQISVGSENAPVFSVLEVIMFLHCCSGGLTIPYLFPYPCPWLCKWSSFISLHLNYLSFLNDTLANAPMK